MLRSKIHRATVTAKSLDYVGSITIDEDLLDRADMREFEKVLVVNLSNGSRAETYAIAGKRGSGDVCLNGAAARLGEVGDRVIVMAFAFVEEAELGKRWKPRIVKVDEKNRPAKTR